jgi:hypothetical protein
VTRLRLEPLPNTQAHLISGAGIGITTNTLLFSLFSATCNQLLVFQIRLANSGRNSVKLASGESLSEIKGYARLYRGLKLNDSGERIQDELRYNGPTKADEDGPAESASYTVTAFLDDRLFDQIVMLYPMVGLPVIDLEFKFRNSLINYGDAPDGSEVLWNNEPRVWESIEGITFTHTLIKSNQ